MDINIMTTIGAIIAKAGHSGRRLSCNIQNNMMIAMGMVVRQSSSTPISMLSMMASGEVRTVAGKYHKCPKDMMAKKAAVQQRSRAGGVTSGAKALARRNSR